MYTGASSPFNYPGSNTSYELAGKFLAGDDLVEEWGCATTFGKQFIPAPYRGVDGASSQFVDVVADLSDYRSDVPKALMRYVLEHNWNWRQILGNFLDSFQQKAVLVLFIPPGEHDINRSFEHRVGHPSTPPGLQLDEDSLFHMLSRRGLAVVDDFDMTNDTPPFGYEHMFFLEKKKRAKAFTSVIPRCKVNDCGKAAVRQVYSEVVALEHRFQYAFNACGDHADRIHADLFSLQIPSVRWPE